MTPEQVNEILSKAKLATPGAEEWDTTEPATESWKSNKAHNSNYIRKANPAAITQLCEAYLSALDLLSEISEV